jgi:hypothetical protein
MMAQFKELYNFKLYTKTFVANGKETVIGSLAAPDITVEWLVILTCVLETLVPNFRLEISHPDRIFASSLSQCKYCNSTLKWVMTDTLPIYCYKTHT